MPLVDLDYMQPVEQSCWAHVTDLGEATRPSRQMSSLVAPSEPDRDWNVFQGVDDNGLPYIEKVTFIEPQATKPLGWLCHIESSDPDHESSSESNDQPDSTKITFTFLGNEEAKSNFFRFFRRKTCPHSTRQSARRERRIKCFFAHHP